MHVERLRAAACAAPRRMSETLVEELESHAVDDDDMPIRMPEWGRAVANQRMHFESCVLIDSASDGPLFYKFLFGMQNPLYIAGSPLTVADRWAPTPMDSIISADEWHSQWHAYVFDVDYMHNVPADVLADVPEWRVHVLQFIQDVGGRKPVSDASPVPLREYLQCLPPLQCKRQGNGHADARAQSTKDIDHDLRGSRHC